MRWKRASGKGMGVFIVKLILLVATINGVEDEDRNKETLQCQRSGSEAEHPQYDIGPRQLQLQCDDTDDTSTQNSCLEETNTIENKYSEKKNNQWNHFRRLIEDAEREHNKTRGTLSKCDKGSCNCYHSVIDRDLSPFSEGISQEMMQMAIPRGVLYQIRNHILYRDPDCKFPARCSGIEHFLLEILNDLPDMEFVINVSDYPQISTWMKKPLTPIFSFSKNAEFVDILYPAWSFWDGGPSISIFPTGLGRWDLLRKSLMKAAKKNSWSEKKSQSFFRGSRTSYERDALILLSRSYPELVDAQYTKNQAWKSDADTLGAYPASEVTLEDHCKYKYLFNFRGVGASFRFKHLFLCQSLVFHVGNEWEEFFYFILKPWIHYIPVEKQSTEAELRSLIEFVQFHDDQAKRIATRGYTFVKSNLRLSHVSCYWKEVLRKYAMLINYQIQSRKDLIVISNR